MTGSRLALPFAFAALLAATPARPSEVPAAPAGDLVERLHGVEVRDPYRALEDLEAPATRAWVAAEVGHTRARLDADPRFAAFRDLILRRTDFDAVGVPVEAGGRLFFLRTPAGESRPSLWMKPGADAEATRLLAASDLPGDERLRGLWPSPDGRRLALGLGGAASPWTVVRVLDVTRRSLLPDRVSGLRGAFGAPAWRADGSAFFYARYPGTGDDPTAPLGAHRLFEHRVGEPAERDRLWLELPEHPEGTLSPWVSADGRHLAVTTLLGTTAGTRIDLLDLGTARGGERPWRTVVPPGPEPTILLDLRDGRMLLQTTVGAPRGRIVEADLARPELASWRTVVAEGPATLYSVNAVADRLVAVTLEDAVHVVRVFGRDGRFERTQPLPAIGTTFSGFVGRPDARHAYFSFNSPAHPGGATVLRLDPRSGETVPFERPALGYDPEDFVVTRAFYPSADGTRVPLFLAHRRDLAPGRPRPVLLYAYGAFGWAALPWYQPQILAWMEAGGIYALAGIRGGGEYGRTWHQAGVGANRRTAIADYYAAGEWLVREKVTSPDLLVANGGSLSGALPALAAIERPELFAAAVVDIPVLDLVRFERFTGGARWASELGAPGDGPSLRRLLDLSPYHRAAGVDCVPPTLVTAGERDQTAVPAHAYKYVAAVQARQRCTAPVLLEVVEGGGHGFGTTPEQSAATWARQLTFLAQELPAGAIAPPAPGSTGLR